MEYKQCVSFVYDKCNKANTSECIFDSCEIRSNREKSIIKETIKRRTEFKNLSKKERNKWCSLCGCEGGCDLCSND